MSVSHLSTHQFGPITPLKTSSLPLALLAVSLNSCSCDSAAPLLSGLQVALQLAGAILHPAADRQLSKQGYCE